MYAKGTKQVQRIRSGQRLYENFMRTKGRRAQDMKIECVRNILDLQYTKKTAQATPSALNHTH